MWWWCGQWYFFYSLWFQSWDFPKIACGRGGMHYDDENKVLDTKTGCACASMTALGEGLTGPARCAPPVLDLPAGRLLPNLGPRSLFLIRRLCCTDRHAPCESLSLAQVGVPQPAPHWPPLPLSGCLWTSPSPPVNSASNNQNLFIYQTL